MIQARMGSTRLRGKVLMTVHGRSLLEHMLERVQRARLIDQIIVVTTTLDSDDIIVEHCERMRVSVMRGACDDVLDRYYQIANVVNASVIVRLTADCPLVDPETIDACISMQSVASVDYVANTAPPAIRTFPDGSDVEVFTYDALHTAWRDAASQPDREHVTHYMWMNPHMFKCAQLHMPIDCSSFRYTVDHQVDLDVVAFLISEIHRLRIDGTVEQLCMLLRTNPHISSLNAMHAFGEGWKKEKHC